MPPEAPVLSRRLRGVLSLEDLEPAARRHLPRPIFGYVAGRAESGWSRSDNRDAYAEWGFRPRVLVDVSGRTQETTLWGRTIASPFGIAPMGFSSLVAYRGDLVLARAAARMGIPMMVSGASLIPMEELIQANPAAWFQAYLLGDETRMAALVRRAAACGFGTLVVTVDVPVAANRENNARAGFITPLRPNLRLLRDGLARPRWSLFTLGRTPCRHGMPHFENYGPTRGLPVIARNATAQFLQRDHLSWRHLEMVRRLWPGRLVVKGLMEAADARLARESGADGVIVSNHGGRQFDGVPSPLRALPEIVAAAGDMVVMLDGGIRRGSDVLKALCLGARCVFVGRPFLYAAALGGEAGVAQAGLLLRQEVDRDMAMLGANRLEELGPGWLRRIK
jgi:L-lactate dehydrogenase (cytochrome)